MTFTLMFWLFIACFGLFAFGLIVRTIAVLKSPGSKFPIGGAWAFADSLSVFGLLFADIWLYEIGEGFGWNSIIGVSLIVSYCSLVKQRKREAGGGGVC
jgi:hypothetical protein